MWLAIDAARKPLRVWTVAGDDAGGAPVAVPDLEAAVERCPGATGAVIDGAPARQLDCPAGIGELRAAMTEARIGGVPCRSLPGLAGVGGVARIAGALAQMRKERPAAPSHLICMIAEQSTWAHTEGDRVMRVVSSDLAAALAGALRIAHAADADDDVAFERGLSLADDEKSAQELLDEPRDAGARGAILAGTLIGRDAATGLRVGPLRGPAALVGEGLLADRYAIALGRFGVAVRRLDPARTFVSGCRALAGGQSIYAGKSTG